MRRGGLDDNIDLYDECVTSRKYRNDYCLKPIIQPKKLKLLTKNIELHTHL